MEILFVIVGLLVIYYMSVGIGDYLEANSQELEIKAREVKIRNQEKLAELNTKINETIDKNKGWYTVEVLDDYVRKNIKTYKNLKNSTPQNKGVEKP